MTNKGIQHLRQARANNNRLFWATGFFSLFVNILMLVGPLYMMQVYDRVLSSRSEATLVALSCDRRLSSCCNGSFGFRAGRIMARAAANLQTTLDTKIMHAQFDNGLAHPSKSSAAGLRDLDAFQRLLTSQASLSVFDLPWTPIFLLVIFLFHPLLGIVAAIGGGVLICASWANQKLSKTALNASNGALVQAESASERILTHAPAIRALGMQKTMIDDWTELRQKSLFGTIQSSDIIGAFSISTKTFRHILQSAILSAGAFLVIQDSLSPGAMIAASLLLGRALAPVEALVGNWPLFQRAHKAWHALAELLNAHQHAKTKTKLPHAVFLSHATVPRLFPLGDG